MTANRRLGVAGAWAVLVIVVLLAWPVRLGGLSGLVVVAGHSMDGTYHAGDLLLTWKSDNYRVGEIIVYRVPDGDVGEGLRVVHRVIGGSAGTGFATRGDNRGTPDIWLPQMRDLDGTPYARLPRGGTVLRWLFSPPALALTCALCVYFLVSRPSVRVLDARPPNESSEGESNRECESRR